MTGHAQFSHDLFGRYHALLIYSAVQSLTKPEFATGDVVALTGLDSSSVSKELGRLASLGVIEAIDRRGGYRRHDESPFWDAVTHLIETADRLDR